MSKNGNALHIMQINFAKFSAPKSWSRAKASHIRTKTILPAFAISDHGWIKVTIARIPFRDGADINQTNFNFITSIFFHSSFKIFNIIAMRAKTAFDEICVIVIKVLYYSDKNIWLLRRLALPAPQIKFFI